jgi:hypothetical protein
MKTRKMDSIQINFTPKEMEKLQREVEKIDIEYTINHKNFPMVDAVLTAIFEAYHGE